MGATAAIASGTETAETEDAQQEKRVCKNEKITGSLTRVRRVCMTQREWDQMADSARQGVNNLERDASRTQRGQQ